MSDITKLKTWLLGALGAAINSGAGGIAIVIVDPHDFNPFGEGGMRLLKVCLTLAIVGAGLYLREHKIPICDDDVERT